MSNPSVRWHRSLYWRIGLGLIAFLALMLAAQAALFVWTTDRIAGSMPARNPARLAALVASDLSSALTTDPAVDLAQYVRDHYGNVYQMFVVVMQDGVTISNHDDVPGPMAAEVRAEFERRVRMIERVERRLDGRGADATQGRGRGRGGIGPARIRLLRSDLPRANLAPVFARDAMVGLVAVAPGPPRITRIARELGPTLAILGGGVLAVGASLIAFVVFGP